MTLALWGAGFLPAFLQLSAFYYITASIIHFGLPAVLPVKGIQQQQRGRWEALRDAVYSIGPSPHGLLQILAYKRLWAEARFGHTL